jgi:3-deoxy-D-manno-octulosonic-acid transferase
VAPAVLWLYRTAMTVALPAAAPWLLLADRRRGKRRPRLRQRLGYGLPTLPQAGVWLQAVSVGEVAVARAVMAELRRRHPGLPLVLSATTATGLALATGEHLADRVVPFPIDLPGPVRRCLNAARPRLVVLIETELWPEMLAFCGQRGIPVVLVNARISDRSFRGYRAIAPLVRAFLRPLTLALAQEDRDARRLAALGVPTEHIEVTGNVKFDAPEPPDEAALAARIERLAAGRPIWIAGSTMAGEEQIVIEALLRLPRELRPFLLLAPRHPERASEVATALSASGLAALRRSFLDKGEAALADVLILDSVGELAALYRLAALAFVGGSLVPTGGHNPIEPGRFGVPILSGPQVYNFASVYRHFRAAGAVVTVGSATEMAAVVRRWLTEPAEAARVGAAARELVCRHAGATARTVARLAPFLQ